MKRTGCALVTISLFLLFINLFCLNTQAQPADNHLNPPAKITFIYGQNLLEMGADKLRIDLTQAGAEYFNENTTDTPVFSPEEGWVHVVLNPSWHAVLVVWEKDIDSPDGGEAKYMFIPASDGSSVLPSTWVQDGSGLFALATLKGVMIRPGSGKGYYFPVSNALGMDEIRDTRLAIVEFDDELEQKSVEVRFSNASLKGIKIGVENRQIGYLVE